MVSTVLVANRGEIANRLCSHLKTLGLRTVAVYSEADAGAPHVAAADASACIGPPPVGESYLNQAAILAAAAKHGADAVHPGYGLLSENTTFARAVVDAGLVWIGPSPEAIEAMGDKVQAREVARAHDVPLVPGSDGLITDDETAAEVAERVGYPVLIKASAGGGGIGMEIAKKPAKLGKALQKCRDRASRAFGSDAVYIEKLVERPRHIEIQVVFDQHGNGVSLFERECSIQRRHQKIVEEAPSVVCEDNPGLRERMGAAAVRLGKAVGYVGVGTVEFLVGATGDFYFMEMNTRLQVEHPVTEQVTGVDLIDQQIRMARGERLDLTPQRRGHSIECRIYAEDPAKKFFPQPGTITALTWPTGPNVRVDSGVVEGSEVTPYYDPLLAKLIVWGEDRAAAISTLAQALEETQLDGLTSNLAFHRWLCTNSAFNDGDLTTNFVKEHFNA